MFPMKWHNLGTCVLFWLVCPGNPTWDTVLFSCLREQVCVGGEGACVEPEDAEDQAGFEEEVKPCLGCML